MVEEEKERNHKYDCTEVIYVWWLLLLLLLSLDSLGLRTLLCWLSAKLHIVRVHMRTRNKLS